MQSGEDDMKGVLESMSIKGAGMTIAQPGGRLNEQERQSGLVVSNHREESVEYHTYGPWNMHLLFQTVRCDMLGIISGLNGEPLQPPGPWG